MDNARTSSTSRIQAASGILLVATLATLGCGDRRPNVLLVTIDTLRADQVGAYGSDRGASPRIDALAAEGVVFERAIAAAPATVPAHASIMTSRWVRGHSVGPANGQTRLEGHVTLADHFGAAGYRTAAFVGNAVLERRTGLDQGFARYDDELPDTEMNRPSFFERTAEKTAARALAWLAEDPSRPFFLWVHYQDPHGPYTPPAGYTDRVRVATRAGEVPLPVLEDDRGVGGIPAYQALPGVTLPSEYERRYAAELLFADEWVGRLLDQVGDAVVLLVSDHGEALGEDDRYYVHEHSTTPELAHVPFILRAPGLASERRRELVSHVDVLPTLLELAGLARPPDAHGLALGPFLRRGEALPERPIYCDRGKDVSVYSANGFVHVAGTLRPWPEFRLLDGWAATPSVERYAWDGHEWTARAEAGELAPAVGTYLENVARLVKAPPMDSTLRRRLRALGYVHEEDGAPQ